MRSAPITDAARGCLSAPATKREVVIGAAALCAFAMAKRPAVPRRARKVAMFVVVWLCGFGEFWSLLRLQSG